MPTDDSAHHDTHTQTELHTQTDVHTQPRLPTEIRRLSHKSRLMSLPQLGTVLGHDPSQLEAMLEHFVQTGELRKAVSDKGQAFYWLVEERF